MGRDINDSSAIHSSSIALLQERFRQLQRVKEMREERELLKMLSAEPKHLNSNYPTMSSSGYEQPTRLFFHPELTIPSRSSPPHVSLSLWPTSQEEEDNKTSIFGTPLSVNSSPGDCARKRSLQASWKNFHDWDSASDSGGVDTSLRL